MSRTLLSLALLAACSPSTSSGDVSLRMRLDDQLARAESTDASGVTFGVDAATLHFDRVDLYLPAGVACADLGVVTPARCDGVDKITLRGSTTVDLATGASTPSLDAVVLPGIDYRRVDVELTPGPDGNTLVASGTRDDTGAAWSLAVAFDEEARFEGSPVFTGGSAASLLLLLDPSEWFAGSPVSACLDSGELATVDGVTHLDDDADGACDDLLDDLTDAVERSGRMASDSDDDGVEDDLDDDDGSDANDDHGDDDDDDANDDHGSDDAHDDHGNDDANDDHGGDDDRRGQN